jgi:hypothetical protein
MMSTGYSGVAIRYTVKTVRSREGNVPPLLFVKSEEDKRKRFTSAAYRGRVELFCTKLGYVAAALQVSPQNHYFCTGINATFQ